MITVEELERIKVLIRNENLDPNNRLVRAGIMLEALQKKLVKAQEQGKPKTRDVPMSGKKPIQSKVKINTKNEG